MTAPAAAALINLLGYITGSVLYAMLLVMALGRQGVAPSIGVGGLAGAGSEKTDRLPLLTALLGLAWNLGAIAAHVMRSFANARPFPSLMAAAFTALGFLPAVVVHSLLRTGARWRRRPAARAVTGEADGLSATAGVLHFQQAIIRGTAPSHWALRILTFGFAALTVALLLIVRRQSGWRRAVWVAAALLYPWLRRSIVRFVDAWLLRRVDYEAMRVEIARRIADHEVAEPMLDEVCERLRVSVTARDVKWTVDGDDNAGENNKTPAGSLIPFINKSKASRRLKEPEPRAVTVSAPTAEPPRYRLLIGELAGGRRLLSDDLDFLESVALMVARRIDAVRVIHERCLRDLPEAELRALRAQINPHFLFNALTTIGYLIQTAPDRALETLMRLTQLLRSVLRRSEGEFATLGQEIELIESYLDIERARFEDRLRVMIDVPPSLRQIRVPALLIQPLVENAIKHGVSPCRAGGEVMILARLARGRGNQAFATANVQVGAPASTEETLQIWVRDTGVGASERELAHGRARGIGLQNVEQRIKRHYGDAATFDIRSASGVGTTVELGLPINLANASIDGMTVRDLQQTSARMYG